MPRLLMLLCFLTLISCFSKEKTVRIDGSSTVFPISEAVLEEFQKKQPIKVVIGVSGTGGGMKKFCTGKIQIAMASRLIKESEIELCAKNNIKYQALEVAYDGIVIAVNPKNTWVSEMTVADLKKLWEPSAQNKILFWDQLNNAWPHKPIHLFAPGVDSGTYDYFTKVIVGKEHASRGDVTSSEDDNVLVQGISTDPFAIGFMGFGYYSENRHKLKALSVNGMMPTFESILKKTYAPLSRPLFIYVREKELKQKKIKDLVNYYLYDSDELIREVGYVPIQNKILL
ncbi:MAG: PstS family phosphate ABC transporter substrate-binding protein [Deltaproteobacteria bacterium]|nr:PstS family phosphate ABC transporter substrate-binding protein [Deltaproteobacteria bacterium]